MVQYEELLRADRGHIDVIARVDGHTVGPQEAVKGVQQVPLTIQYGDAAPPLPSVTYTLLVTSDTATPSRHDSDSPGTLPL